MVGALWEGGAYWQYISTRPGGCWIRRRVHRACRTLAVGQHRRGHEAARQSTHRRQGVVGIIHPAGGHAMKRVSSAWMEKKEESLHERRTTLSRRSVCARPIRISVAAIKCNYSRRRCYTRDGFSILITWRTPSIPCARKRPRASPSSVVGCWLGTVVVAPDVRA